MGEHRPLGDTEVTTKCPVYLVDKKSELTDKISVAAYLFVHRAYTFTLGALAIGNTF